MANLEVKNRIFAMTKTGYWGSGEELETALENVRKQGGRGVEMVSVYAFRGTEEMLNQVRVNGMGSLSYPIPGVTFIAVGKTKMRIYA